MRLQNTSTSSEPTPLSSWTNNFVDIWVSLFLGHVRRQGPIQANFIGEGRTWAIAVRRGSNKSLFLLNSQDHGKGGLSLRGVAVTTETAETVKTVSWYCISQEKQKEGKVLSRTAKTVKTTKTVIKATPLKLHPPFPSS